MKHRKLLLILSLSLCIHLSSVVGEPKRNKCPENMDLVRCSNEFQGVCAFFEDESCEDGVSQKYSANGCIACLDSQVKYFIDGPCDGDKVFCDDNVRPEFCTKEYHPVCGYSSDCEGDQCGITAGNKCMACANAEINWYVPGECPQNNQQVVCDPNNRPEVCTLIYAPVCGTLENCIGGICTQTYGNGCAACGDQNVISHVPGECPPTQCDPDNRPEACTRIYAPVCANLENCIGSSCTRTAGNACTACSDSNVISYLPGECPIVETQCDPDNRPEVCNLMYAPVCGTLESCIGGICTQTYGNDCTACGDPNVVSHVPGECPPTQCDPDNRPEACTLIYAPVCANLADCSDDSCTQTAGNACMACGDPNVISYVPGECPIVETQCDPENGPEVCLDIYKPVCATLADCSDSPCTQTEGNSCYACSNPNVISHVPGECP